MSWVAVLIVVSLADQIKQHIQIVTLRSSNLQWQTNVKYRNTSPAVAPKFAESIPITDPPSDKQFQHIARWLSLAPFIRAVPPAPATNDECIGDVRLLQPRKRFNDEVQNLRPDLSIMRQLYSEFIKPTKESLNTLRMQTQSMKQIASAQVGGARGYIATGKGGWTRAVKMC